MKKSRIDTYREYDEHELKSYRKVIENLQNKGVYPYELNMPLLLQLELTARCNVRCKHCYNNSGVKLDADRMTPERWIEFAKYIVKHGGLFECVISGGEPLLLGEDLFKIMDILHDDGTIFLLITNGYLLNKEVVKKLSKYNYKWLQVSIDGSTREYHDDFRQKKGSWERAVRGAYEVSKAGIPLTIAHSVSPSNLNQIDDMCKLAYDLGAGSIIVGEIIESGRTYQNSEILLNNEQREIFFEAIERNTDKYKGKMNIKRSADTGLQLKKYRVGPSTGGIIRPDGSVRMDCMMPFTLGNILEEDFLDIWSKKGKNCWNNDKVVRYIDKYIENKDSIDIKNYVDKDIIL